MTIFNPDGTVRPGRVWTYIAAFVAALIAFWAISVAISGTKGTGDIQRQRGTATNREHWSTVFNGAYQQIQADAANIAVAKQAATAPGATKQDQINLTGVTQNCNTDVATYNGLILDALAVVPDGLPSSIPTTVCGG